ncbi:MAG: hypothetical protein ACP5OJ_05505 [Methanothermobacter sp.]
MQSQIYIKCPQCHKQGLIIENRGRYLCAVCKYDYTTLDDDPSKLDEIILENLEAGSGPMPVIALYEWITLKLGREAAEHIQRLAKDNNVKLFK